MTLIELLIVLVITAILASAIGYAFTAELTMQRVEEARRADWTGATRRSGGSRGCCKGRSCRPGGPGAAPVPPAASGPPVTAGPTAAAGQTT